jgi:hypothetical protein
VGEVEGGEMVYLLVMRVCGCVLALRLLGVRGVWREERRGRDITYSRRSCFQEET